MDTPAYENEKETMNLAQSEPNEEKLEDVEELEALIAPGRGYNHNETLVRDAKARHRQRL